ncbi:hypothetical protein AU476_37185 [Cupriavidus sp. UYMSc13B]|nr:hypothetical protein AU476_37185 [Cupriavidus sp. UYMSc13B]
MRAGAEGAVGQAVRHGHQRRVDLAALALHPALAAFMRLALGCLQAHQQRSVEQAVGQRLPAADFQALAPACGIIRLTGVNVSTYSTITRESKIAPPSSMTRQGTLPSGLNWPILVSGDQTSSSMSWHSIFFSAITTRTLRA